MDPKNQIFEIQLITQPLLIKIESKNVWKKY